MQLPSVWQREKDSNPHKQSQSLSCYPYTIPLFHSVDFFQLVSLKDRCYYTRVSKNVNRFFEIF